MSTIYFDYNATTPLDPQIREAMLPFLGEVWGNPSSAHRVGRTARAALDEARDRAAKVLGCRPSELVFTSGGSESVNTAIFGAARLLKKKGRHIITSSIEHHAVLHSCQWLAKHEGFEITLLPVDARGRVSPQSLEDAIRPDTVLVSVMAANNEIGTLQPVAELGEICRRKGVIFHTDAVQWLGKEPLSTIHQFNADLVSICAHKMHGPKGAGALFIRSPLRLEPLLLGGTHENEHRAGTENLAGIIGLVEAMERFVRAPVFPAEQLAAFTNRLLEMLASVAGVHVVSPPILHGEPRHRLANTIAFAVEGTDSIALLAGLDLEGICASSGAACSAGSLEPSHVLRALGLGHAVASSLVRFSLGRDNTEIEIEEACRIVPDVIRRAQQAE